MTSERFTAEPTLRRLKDFQRRTVDYVFDRLYRDDPPARRFLVADEVGLGKTMVARGVIARAFEHLDDKVDRVDFVYVCSNAAIAHQNISRLNVLGRQGFALASRLTLLPTQVADLRKHHVNFVSFTPGTTFDLKSRSGIMWERSLLFRMLRGGRFDEPGLLHLLQGSAGQSSWRSAAFDWAYRIDDEIASTFRDAVESDVRLGDRLDALCDRFHAYREVVPEPDSDNRYALIGDLRQLLARVCLDALEPDLVILDEFQRFRSLLRKDDPTAALAQALFNFPDVRVLLLSATPYKMLSLDHELGDDHYPDLLQTLRFLFDSEAAVDGVRQDIEQFRRALLALDPTNAETVRAARDALRERLRTVMTRTERVGKTVARDAMLREPWCQALIEPGDLGHARLVDGVSRVVGARDALEYWKSAPYPVNLMKGYDLRRRVDDLADGELADVLALLERHDAELLNREHFEGYQPVPPANARLRYLAAETLDRGLWRVLWMPPSLPAWQPAGPFAVLDGTTKSLVFSAWNVVPDAIAALCSYEAERRAVRELGRDIAHSEFHDAVKPLLRYSRDARGRLTGMPALLLQYPSPALAAMVDPVAVSLGSRELPALDEVVAGVASAARSMLASLLDGVDDAGRVDERWYWVAVARLDAARFPATRQWLEQWVRDDSSADGDVGSGFREHVEQLLVGMTADDALMLGRPPDDLAEVIARVALAGPATCALRSLRRVAPGLAWDAPALLGAAAMVGVGFRTLFNVPESIAILRGDDGGERYWMLALEHALHGNLGALLDEQVHVLVESLGVVDAGEGHRVERVAAELRESLSIRTSQLQIDELRSGEGGIVKTPFKVRCRFALRFGDMKDEKGEARAEAVRSAFNSPFRPFVLASTSVGQEGLDFHLWCHAVVHWNLPSNPVDLEQREGRVHRYKGHAVRKNVAAELGHDALREAWRSGDDPWRVMFARARELRGADLQAFWLFETEGGAKVERRVPLLPFSREAGQLARLKHGLALYRLVFGQPRQEDLLTHLGERLAPDEIERIVDEWRIDLAP